MVLYEEKGKIVNRLITRLKETIRLDVDKGRRCIPRCRLKEYEGSMLQTCRKINVYVVNTNIC